MNEDKTPKISSHKDLLYSEILNTSVTGHVCDLFEKRQKSCTFPIQRNTVLARASKFLKSAEEVGENFQNIEEVEDGQPVIDMDVTLIERAVDSESDTEFDLKEENSDDETEDDESTTSSDSDNEIPDEMKVELEDKLVREKLMANGELLQKGRRNTLSKGDCMLSNLKSKHPESEKQEDILSNKKFSSSTDSDYEQSDSRANKVDLYVSPDLSNKQLQCDKKSIQSSVKSNHLSGQESENQNGHFLEFSETKFEFLNSDISDSSQNLQESKKRKLIAVIEDGDSFNLYQTKSQKLV